MSNLETVVNWVKAPENPEDLPWPVKAGRRLMWFIVIEACDQYPEDRFMIVGSLKAHYKNKYTITDKQAGYAVGYFYHTVTAYAELPAEPSF